MALESLGKLERLRVRGCSKLSHSTLSWLPHLRGLKRLQELWVGIQDRWGLRALSGLTQLVNLNLQQTTQMETEHLKELSSLVNLRSLCLQGCGAVRSGSSDEESTWQSGESTKRPLSYRRLSRVLTLSPLDLS